MDDMKKKAAGLQRLAKAMSEYRAQQKLMAEREHEQNKAERELREREAAEKKVMETAVVDGGDHA
jgi:hypothetical protein